MLVPSGDGKLRVRFTAPPAEPACSHVAVKLRKVGASTWLLFDNATKQLVEAGDKAVPADASEVVAEGLSAGSWEAIVAAKNTVGWSVFSPNSSSIAVADLFGSDDDDEVAVVGSQSWAERDRELRKRAIDVEDEEQQETAQGPKRQKPKRPTVLHDDNSSEDEARSAQPEPGGDDDRIVISEEQARRHLVPFLTSADLNTVTAATARVHLETQLGLAEGAIKKHSAQGKWLGELTLTITREVAAKKRLAVEYICMT